MAKIPRYISGQTNVGMLEQGRNVIISPAEAARAASSKYTAIASVASTIGDVFTGIAQIKADEEFATAKTVYARAVTQLHEDLENTPIELDDFGNIIYDEQQLIRTEREARASLQEAIRGNLKSNQARKMFGGFITGSTEKLSTQFASNVAKASTKIIKANTDNQIHNLLNLNLFDEADIRNEDALRSGAYGAADFSAKRQEIKSRRTINSVWDVLNTPPEIVDKTDINNELDILQDPLFTDLPDDEKGILIGKLTSQLDGLDKIVDEKLDDYYRAVYNEMLPLAVNGKLSLSDLIDSGIPPDDSLFQDLLTRVVGKRGETKSEAGVLEGFRNRIRRLSSRSGMGSDEDWGKSVGYLIDEMQEMDSGLNYTDAQNLADELTSDLSALYGTEKYKNLNRQAYQLIAGYEPGMFDNMEAMFSAQFKEANTIALKFQEEMATKAKQLGPQRIDELPAWLDEQAPLFKARLNDKLFRSVGVNIDWDSVKGGFTQELKLDVARQMHDHLFKYPADLRKVKDVIVEMERLNDIKLIGLTE